MKKTKRTITMLAIIMLCVLTVMPVSAATKISKKSAALTIGQTLQLQVTGTKSKVKWSTSKKSVATVTSKGKVTAKKKGTATITAKVGKKSYKCKVTVKAPAVVLSEKAKTIYVNNSFDLTLKNTKSSVKWSTSNKNVAAIKKISKYKYRVTGKKAGTAIITAKIGAKKYTCKVTVKNENTGSVTYTSASTDYGAVIIAKNNYSYIIDLNIDCIYYKNGQMVKKSSCGCYALEPGRECALRAWNSDCLWDNYILNVKATKATNIIGNASKISVTSNFGNDRNVIASVRNTGVKNSYTLLAVVYYKNGQIVGYDEVYADVQTPGSLDYVEFYHPYDRNYRDIETDSYKVYVNESYTYTWMN